MRQRPEVKDPASLKREDGSTGRRKKRSYGGLGGSGRAATFLVMGIQFRLKPGTVLYCDFNGYISPEMLKCRPVVVVSPSHMARMDLVTVVPLSTTAPAPVQKYHYRLVGNPIPGDSSIEVWAKCDMVATVSFARLDRVKLGRGSYQVGNISIEQVKAIRRAALVALGIDLNDPRTYT